MTGPLAIVGADCRLPGADGLAAYWSLLEQGRSAVTEMPPHRLDRRLYLTDGRGVRSKTYSAVAGIVTPRPIDRSVCPISDADLADHDPCHVDFCEVVARAFADAGLKSADVAGARCGVYVGHSGGSPLPGDLAMGVLAEEVASHLDDVSAFRDLPDDVRRRLVEGFVAGVRETRPVRRPGGKPLLAASGVAALVMKVFGLDGPHYAIDAACASSLVALAAAGHALESGSIDLAVVGGATWNKADSLILFSASHACSATGSRPFDSGADGLVSSEGHAAVVVKTLDRALADGDRIRGVVQGIGVSTDGRGRSLWAPRKEGQVAAIRRAYPTGAPDRIDYLEAHATSTQVGDATELSALAEVFGDGGYGGGKGGHGRRVPIGSVKANIGHSLETAGVASLVKVLLAMEHGVIPPTINVETPNDKLDWSTVPFDLPKTARPWPTPPVGERRRAAVNAFGIGGLNVHLVVEDGAPLRAVPSKPRSKPTTASEPIAVIGRGLILPGATGVEELAALLASDRSLIGPADERRWRPGVGLTPGASPAPYHAPTNRGGFVVGYAYDWRRHVVPPKQVERGNPLQFMLLDAVSQALAESGYDAKPLDKARTAVVVGNVFGGEFGNGLQMGLRLPEWRDRIETGLDALGVPADKRGEIVAGFEAALLDRKPALLDETGSFTSSTLASRITKTFDFMGGAMAIDADDVSGLAGLNVACDLLRGGRANTVFCGAAQRWMDLGMFESLDLSGVLRRDGRPDDDVHGTVPGEGVVVLLLKRHADAVRDGDPIFGVIRGVGAAADHDAERAAARSADRAARQAGPSNAAPLLVVNPQESFGRAGETGDAARIELDLIRRIGHLHAAQGLVSLVAATLAGPVTDGKPTRLTTGLTSPESVAYHVVMEVNDPLALQFGRRVASAGRKDSVVVQRPTPTLDPSQTDSDGDAPGAVIPMRAASAPRCAPAARDEAPRTFFVCGPDWTAVRARLSDLRGRIGRGDAAAAGSLDPAEPCRVAIVAGDEGELAAKIDRALPALADPAMRARLIERGIVAVQAGTRSARVAWLFPGQGAQYADMLRDVVAASPAARRRVEEFDALLTATGEPTFADMAWGAAGGLGRDAWTTQAAVLVANAALQAALTARGVPVDCVGGHSFGAYSAALAAGVMDDAQAVRVTKRRAESVELTGRDDTAMVSVGRGLAEVQAAIRASGLAVWVTHANTASQTVVGGMRSEVEAFRKFLSDGRTESVLLPVPGAFHLPLRIDAADLFRTGFAGERLLPPARLTISCLSGQYLSEPEALRDDLIGQFTRPVAWTTTVSRLADDGVGLLLEVGPNAVLTKMNREIVRGRDVLALAVDSRGKDAEAQFALIDAALACLGRRVEPVRPESVILRRPAPSALYVRDDDEFDATQRRKARRKEENITKLAPRPAAATGDRPAPEAPRTNGASGHVNGAAKNGSARPQAAAVPSAPSAALVGADRLTELLIDLIVEQTGYPREIIDVDADFEADLGIDSIKKAQLFGEVRDLLPTGLTAGTLKLDDYNTLRQIAALLGESSAAAPAAEFAANAEPARPVVAPRGDGAPAPAVPPPAVRATAAAPSSPAANAGGPTTDELTEFLIDLVVEQTGYPRDIVDLDADLEADLGIDSIKQAQLLGEVRDHFGVQAIAAAGKASLSDLRTLRDIARLLGGGNDRGGAPSDGSSPNPLPAAAKPIGPGGGARPEPQKNGHKPNGVHVAERTAPVVPRRTPAQAGQIRARLQEMVETAGGTAVAERDFSETDWNWIDAEGDAAAAPRESVAAFYAKQPHRPEEYTTNAEGGEPRRPITSRHLLRALDAPQRPGMPETPRFNGPALILGDNPIADAFAGAFESMGLAALRCPHPTDADAAVRWLNETWDDHRARHLFITTPHDAAAIAELDWSAWRTRRATALDLPFKLCQAWMSLVGRDGLMDEVSIVGLTGLGGALGSTGAVPSPEGGAIAGLLKAILIESWVNGHRATPIKVIDTPPGDDPAAVVRAVWRELAVPTYDLETCWADGKRRAFRAVLQPTPKRTDRKPPTRGGNWVVTGGARGITQLAARELAKKHGLRLHLLGTAPPPRVPDHWRGLDDAALSDLKRQVMQSASAVGRNPSTEWQTVEKAIEIDRNLRELKAEGIDAAYHSCDVADHDQLAKVLERVRAAGPIRGILHGAGIGKDARFDRKDLRKVAQCLGAKNDGAVALMDLTSGDPLEYFVGFGSISGRFGANGHTDYSMANDMLAKQMDWFRGKRPEVGAVAFHWHAWGDVGMATKPETKLALEMIDMQFMPAVEGVAHLLAEIEAGAPEPEVLITDERYTRKFYPADATLRQEGDGIVCPFLDEAAADEVEPWSIALDPTVERFLKEHRIDNRPVLPFVFALEMLSEAARKKTGRRFAVGLSGVVAKNGVRFPTDVPLTVRLFAEADGNAAECALRCDLRRRDGVLVEADRDHFLATVETSDTEGRLDRVDLDVPPDGDWRRVEYPGPETKIYHGPPLRGLKRYLFDGDRLLGEISAPAVVELAGPDRDVRGWTIPCGALDACLFAVGVAAWNVRPAVTLPVGFGEIKLGRLPDAGETCIVEVRHVGSGERTGFFDFRLVGRNGDLLIDVRQFEAAWVGG